MSEAKTMLTVKATAVGYFGHLREPGDVFDVEDTKENRESPWFKEHVPVEEEKPAKGSVKK